MRSCGYTSGRDVGNLFGADCPCPYAETIPPNDAYRLRTADGVTGSTTLADLQASVTNAETHGGGWVPLVFHGICDNSCTGANSVTVATFTAFLDWLQPRSSAGTTVRTVGEVVGGGKSRAQRLAVRVRDSRLVGWRGAEVRLLGVNRSGTQYACAEGWGIFNGPTDDAALSRIADWGANAVRVPLNESCWLGINGVDQTYSGETYRTAIREYVDRLNAAGLRVILDLHWTAPGEALATDQQPMADRDHAPDFWRSVAQEFKHNRSVVFDLFNEPYPDSNASSAAAWECVREREPAPGSPTLLRGCRSWSTLCETGARNVLMIGGPQYAGTLEKWTDYQPDDPSQQLVASIHIYLDAALPSGPRAIDRAAGRRPSLSLRGRLLSSSVSSANGTARPT